MSLLSDVGGRRPTPDLPTVPKRILTMPDTEVLKTLRRALNYGGGFTAALAKAALLADEYNRAKILTEWPYLFNEYGPESNFEEV